ncbi:MAG: hypothetical protein ACE5OZ_09460 [Candidatus Heimdallarchaeota archaeon]
MNFMEAAYIMVHAANIVAIAFGLALVVRIYIQTKIRIILLLVVGALTWMLVNINLLLPILFPQIDFKLVAGIHNILFVLNLSCFILFFNAFRGDISPIKLSFASSIVVATVFLTIAGIWYDFAIIGEIYQEGNLKTFVWGPLLGTVITAGAVFCGIWGLQDLSDSLRHAIDSTQIQQIQRMRAGIIMSFFVGMVFAIPGYVAASWDQLELSIWFAMILAWIPSIIGVLLLILSYLSAQQIAFLQPQRVDSLIVIHKSGLPLLEYGFRPDIIEKEVSLVSGAITAVKTLMAEAFGVSTDIERIIFQDRHILLVIKEQVAFILITGRTSLFLVHALDSFSKIFCQRFQQSIAKFSGSISEFGDAIPDLRVAFGLAVH